jgi:hypothetical protein
MAEQPLTIKVAEGTCADGCGAEVTKGRRFRQGHDASLRGALGRAYKAGIDVVYNGKRSSAEAALKEHGFPIPPATKTKAKTTKAKAKTTAKRTATKRTARKPRTTKTKAA